MKLTKQQFLQIQTALLDGYDRAGLRRLVRLGLDTSLDEITSGTTDNDVMFDVIEWAERGDNVSTLIRAAVEHNSQNEALRQLKQDSSAWFAPGGSKTPAETRQAAGSPAAQTAALPPYSAGGDIIIANIGGSSENVAVGKNIHQSTDNTKPRKKK